MASNLIKPKITPGVVKDSSALDAEGTWIDSDKIRFNNGKPEVIGGWEEPDVTQDATRASVFDSGVFDSAVFRTSLTATAEMYPGQVRGAHSWSDLDGKVYLAWGTADGLFVMYDSIIYDITPMTFVPDTGDAGSTYGTGAYGASTYGGTQPIFWSLDNWGENLLACPRGQTLFEWVPGDVMATAVTNAPSIIEYMFVSPERIVVLLGTAEFGGSVYNPMLVRWSAQGDNTDWTPSSFNIAGEFPLSHGSKLVGGLVTRSQNLVWSDTTLYTMQFTGDANSVFILKAVGHGCGLIGPHAMAASDSAVYWVSHDNFFGFTGQVPSILNCPVRRDVFENLDTSNGERVHVGWNTGFAEPWFFYPDIRDNTGECSRYATMSPDGAWAVGSFDRTAWVSAGVLPFPVAFSTDHKLYYHEVPNAGAAGSTLSAFVESGFIDVGDGATLYVIKRIVPDFDDQAATVDFTFKTRMWPNGAITERGPYSATPTTEKLDMRVKCREVSIRLDSDGDPDASFWSLGAVAFDAQPSGEKR